MEGNNFQDFIGEPIDIVVDHFEKNGYEVQVVKNSKPKIKTDSELVVSVKMIGEKQVLLVVGDFLINLEVKDGLV